MTEPAAKPKGDVWGAVKWLCILLVTLVIAAGAWKAWSVATAPARAVTSTMEAATQTTTESIAKVTGYLDIQVTQQRKLNKLAEAAFVKLAALPVREAGMKDRATRASYLRGSQNRVCETQIMVGDAPVTVWAAADNDGYETSKTMGGQSDRLIRMALFAPGDTVGMRALWDAEAQAWRLRWKRTTLKKPVVDAVAEARIWDMLTAVAQGCGPN